MKDNEYEIESGVFNCSLYHDSENGIYIKENEVNRIYQCNYCDEYFEIPK